MRVVETNINARNVYYATQLNNATLVCDSARNEAGVEKQSWSVADWGQLGSIGHPRKPSV